MPYLQNFFNFGVTNKYFSSGHKIKLTNIVYFYSITQESNIKMRVEETITIVILLDLNL